MTRIYRYLLYILVAALLPTATLARELQVKSFETLPLDLTARMQRVDDINGKMCALIKVALPVEGCKFDGNVLRQSFDVNEYHVYIAQGSKWMQVRCPGFETLQVELRTEDGTVGVESGVTYSLKLSGYEEATIGSPAAVDPGANYLILDITPKTGVSVKVDGMLQPVDNGQTMTYLKYGPHSYAVDAEGYASVEGTAVIGRDGNTTVSVRLESIMATLAVKTETTGATIKINGQAKGTGSTSGQYAPGVYQIEVEKAGYRPHSQTIELSERDNQLVVIPALTPIYGALNVAYKPIGASISIDGKDVGTTPMVLRELLVGQHEVSIIKDGYSLFVTNVEIVEGQTAQVEGSLSENASDKWREVSPQDIEKYRKAAKQGGVIAQYDLGECYFNGQGVFKDYNEAVKWYRKAAEQGYAPAQYALGFCYDYGRGVTQDDNEAVKWYRKSAEQGYADAQNKLGWCYQFGQGVARDDNEAVKWYRKSAEQGHANAQYGLGLCYDYGRGVTQDYNEAVKWYRKAAEQGDERAIKKLKEMNQY